MTPTDKPMTIDALIENTRLAWYLGQKYWQQADSESYAENRRYLTLEKFNKLLESSRAAIEQYGREQYARGVNDAWPAGRGSGEPVAFAYKSTQQPHDIHITSTARNNTARGLACGISFPVYTSPQHREPLTDEQIDRHTLLAQECPPGSKVILVSSLRRLRAHNIRSKG